MANLGSMWVTLGVDATQLEHAVASVRRFETKTNAALRRVQKNFQVAGASMKTFGRSLSQFVTLPMALVGGAAFKMYKDFEFSMNKVVSLVGIARKQVDQWSKEVLALAPAVGKSPVALADAMYFITSAGIRGAEVLEILNESARSSAGGLGEVKVVADLLTSAMNAYGKANLTASRANDILVATVREGKAEADLLAQSMGLVLPIASAMGSTFDQVGAATAAMTRTGTKAATAAIQLRQIFNSLLKPAEEAEAALKGMGTSSEELRTMIREKGLLTALQELDRLQKEYGINALGKVIPNIRSLTGVLDIMGKNAAANAVIFERIRESVGDANKMFEETAHTVEFRLNAAMAGVRSSFVTFGETVTQAVLPILEKISMLIQNVVSRFDDLSERGKRIRIVFAGIIFVLGPLITLLGFLVGNVIPGFLIMGRAMNKVLANMSVGFLKLGISIQSTNKFIKSSMVLFRNLWKVIAANPIVAVIGAVVALTSVLLLRQRRVKEMARIEEEFSKRMVDATDEQIRAARKLSYTKEKAFIEDIARANRADKINAPFKQTISLIEQMDTLFKKALTLPKLDKVGVQALMSEVKNAVDSVREEALRLEHLGVWMQIDLGVQKIKEIEAKLEVDKALAPLHEALAKNLAEAGMVDFVPGELTLPAYTFDFSEAFKGLETGIPLVSGKLLGRIIDAFGWIGKGEVVKIPALTITTDVTKLGDDAVAEVEKTTQAIMDKFTGLDEMRTPLEKEAQRIIRNLTTLRVDASQEIDALDEKLAKLSDPDSYSPEQIRKSQQEVADAYLEVMVNLNEDLEVLEANLESTWEQIMKEQAQATQSLSRAKISTELATQLQAIAIMGKLTWSELDVVKARTNALDQAMQGLAANGADETNAKMIEYNAQLEVARERLVFLEQDTVDLTEAMRTLQSELASAAMTAAAFPEFLPGSHEYKMFESFLDVPAKNIKAYETYLDDLSKKISHLGRDVQTQMESFTGLPFDMDEIDIGLTWGAEEMPELAPQIAELEHLKKLHAGIVEILQEWYGLSTEITYDELKTETNEQLALIHELGIAWGKSFDVPGEKAAFIGKQLEDALAALKVGDMTPEGFKEFFDEFDPKKKGFTFDSLNDLIDEETAVLEMKSALMGDAFKFPEESLRFWEGMIENIFGADLDTDQMKTLVDRALKNVDRFKEAIEDSQAWENFLKNAQQAFQGLGNLMSSLQGLFEQQMRNRIMAVEEYAKRHNKSEKWLARETEKIREEEGKQIKAMAIATALVNGALAITNILANVPGSGANPWTWVAIGLTAAATAAQVATISAQPLAAGGVIPTGYPNDTYPAMLTSGELVLPADKWKGVLSPDGELLKELTSPIALSRVLGVTERVVQRDDFLDEFMAEKAAGMARGGLVPPGYPDDSYPAMLTSGEIVLPESKWKALLTPVEERLDRPDLTSLESTEEFVKRIEKTNRRKKESLLFDSSKSLKSEVVKTSIVNTTNQITPNQRMDAMLQQFSDIAENRPQFTQEEIQDIFDNLRGPTSILETITLPTQDELNDIRDRANDAREVFDEIRTPTSVIDSITLPTQTELTDIKERANNMRDVFDEIRSPTATVDIPELPDISDLPNITVPDLRDTFDALRGRTPTVTTTPTVPTIPTVSDVFPSITDIPKIPQDIQEIVSTITGGTSIPDAPTFVDIPTIPDVTLLPSISTLRDTFETTREQSTFVPTPEPVSPILRTPPPEPVVPEPITSVDTQIQVDIIRDQAKATSFVGDDSFTTPTIVKEAESRTSSILPEVLEKKEYPTYESSDYIAKGLVSPQKLAAGGVVPQGYPKDTYPALLSSGETVTPPIALSGDGGGGIKTIELVIGVEIEGDKLVGVMRKQISLDENY